MPVFETTAGRLEAVDTRPIVVSDDDDRIDAQTLPIYQTLSDAVKAGAGADQMIDAVVREAATEMMSLPYFDDMAAQGYRDIGGNGLGGPMNGQNGPIDLDPATRRMQVGLARTLAMVSPPAKNALRLHRTYVIGAGIPMPTSPDSDVQDVIEDLWDDPDNAELCTHQGQAETDASWLIAGELFMAFYVDESDGHVKMRSVEPLDVDAVVTHPDDRKRILYYRVRVHRDRFNFRTGQSDDEADSREEFVYFPDWRNTDEETDPYSGKALPRAPGGAVLASFPRNRQGVRGIPEFSAATPWIISHKRLIENQSVMAEARKKIALIKTAKGGPQAVQSLAAAERSSMSGPGGINLGMLERNPPPAVGSTLYKSQGIDVDYPDLSTGADDASRDAELQAQMIGAALGWGTHYLLMSTEFHRLATAVTMELPTLKACLEGQQRWLDMLESILTFALLKACKAGTIRAPIVVKHGREVVDWSKAEPAPPSKDEGKGGTPASDPAQSDTEPKPAPTPDAPVREADPTDILAQTQVQKDAASPDAVAKTAQSQRGHVDIDMPPILERDLKPTIDAIEAASTGGHITPEQAAREVMMVLGIGDVSSALEEWRRYVETKGAQVEEEAKKAQAMAQQALAAKGAGAGPGGPPKPGQAGGGKPAMPTQGAGVPSGGMSGPAG